MSSHSVKAAIDLRLSLLGLPVSQERDTPDTHLFDPILARQRDMNRLLGQRLCAADQRIQDFLDSYLAKCHYQPQLPRETLVLDEAGLARGLSLPHDGDEFHSDLLSSYRLVNGVLHNPANDRRTTAGVFHIVEGGLDIPDDKIAVSKDAFAQLLQLAFEPPRDSMILPFTSTDADPAACWVSLLMRPIVAPQAPGRSAEKRMEIRFIVPGGLVCNLDFVESIFGNAGDPFLPDNDSALDPRTWTGHTGAVVLAPHLTQVTKQSLGLPHWDDATPRQRRDGQCWKAADELYNGGEAFKICARDERGVIVTVIADNYFGYCKKEVKTQISYSANLHGCAEEEHSGGALCFPAYNLGDLWYDKYSCPEDGSVAEVVARDPERFQLQPEGHALDLHHPHLVLVPGNATYSMREQTITWDDEHGATQSIKLLASKNYLSPNGYRVRAKHREEDPTHWHLVGAAPHPTHCHKPATVSGGGKSEISKSLLDAFVFSSAYSQDFEEDMDAVESLLDRDYSNRYAEPDWNGKDIRSILSENRSLGSVIKLMTPSDEFSDKHNRFLSRIKPHIKELLFMVKLYYKPEWGDEWRSHFSVSISNGRPGNEVRLDQEPVIVNMLRVGFETDGSWRLFSLRPDFSPAFKVQTEDDITASTVVSPEGSPDGLAYKLVENCERRLFQRPDEAIHRGYDKQAEADLATPGTFISNFAPLTHADARTMVEDVRSFSEYTDPMRNLITQTASLGDDESPQFFVGSANPRMVDGKPSKNPRYLQVRPDLSNPQATATAELMNHLRLKLPTDQSAPMPVDVIAAGRRNNPKEAGVPPLCSYNPLHYMELPELFMEYISSMTGKSPSTTGAGSEGALTKGPFNALPAVIDLNAALLSYVLTGYDGWLSSAGFIGPQVRVDHDLSLLVPELFSRMGEDERCAQRLIEGGYLEPLEDFDHEGRRVLASRLGYRINKAFAVRYFGRIFLHPDVVFTDEMLAPELQDIDTFAESIDVIAATHQRVAEAYFEDGTVAQACPPLRGLLEIMAHGTTAEGYHLGSPQFRDMFSRESVLASDWYIERLDAKQAEDVRLTQLGIDKLERFLASDLNQRAANRIGLTERLQQLHDELAWVSSAEYRQRLIGTTGLQVNLG